MKLHRSFHLRLGGFHDYLHFITARGHTKERLNLVNNEIVKVREDRGNSSPLIFSKIFRKNKAQQSENKGASALHIPQ